MFKTEVTGLDPQTARLNSRPLTEEEKEDTRDALTVYREWEARIKKKLGIVDIRENIANDNPALLAGLAKIKASGAPVPVIVKNVVAYPADPKLSFENDCYVFTHGQNPRLQITAGEYLIATEPDRLIEELRVAGIRKA